MQELSQESNSPLLTIKYIQLWGFKTFPQRTVLRFSNGINVIVGPNGCGKSNIIDAIRWVLGEQSPTILRAKSMDELIYSGDSSNCNFAEVQLGLLSFGYFPMEFRDNLIKNSDVVPFEVTISRRLYKDGESEYRINGRECRLKDIQYFFMDTGAGTKAYSIVDQGQIGKFVEMTPKERKILIEEAAGINKYKLKREETLKKINETKVNIETLDKIILEIETHLNSLSSQLEKTRIYLRLKKEEENTKKFIFIKKWVDLKNSLNEYTQKYDEYNKIILVQKEEVEKSKKIIISLEQKIRDIQNNIKNIENDIINFTQENDNLLNIIHHSEKELITLKNTENNLVNSINEFDNKKNSIIKRQIVIDKEIKDIENEIKKLNNQKIDLEKEITKIEDNTKIVKEEIKVIKNELVDTLANLTKLETEKKALENELNKILINKRKYEEELKQLNIDLDTEKNIIFEINNNIQEKQTIISEIKNKISSLISKKSEIEIRLKEVQKNKKNKNTILSELKTKYNVLNDIFIKMEGISESNKILARSFKEHQGFLYQNLNVDQGYEHIFDIILANMLDNIVINDISTLKNLLDFIKKNKINNAKLLIPQLLSSLYTSKDNDLINHINTDQSLMKIIIKKLNDWQIFNNIDDAIDYIKENSPNKYILIDDIIFTPYGEVIIGKQSNPINLILKKNELTSLIEKINIINEEIKKISTEENQLSQEFNRINEELNTLLTKKDSLEKEIVNLSNKINVLNTKIEAKKERISILNFEILNLTQEFDEKSSSLTSYSENLNKFNKQKETSQKILNLKESILLNLENSLKKIKNEHQEKMLIIDRLINKKQNLKKEQEDLIRKLERIDTDKNKAILDLEKIKTKILSLNNEVNTLNTKKENIQRILNDIKNKQQKFIDELNQQRNEYDILKKKIFESELKLSEIINKQNEINIHINNINQEIDTIKETYFNLYQKDIINEFISDDLKNLSIKEAEKRLISITKEINKLGPINLTAEDEYNKLYERYDYLVTQKNDLINSLQNLNSAIQSIDNTCNKKFKETLEEINSKLKTTFESIFEGGEATLKYDSDSDGIDFLVKLPGKKLHNLSMLSGGEKALCAITLIFSLFSIKPSPFCILDEADAPLDEVNTLRFCNLVKEIAKSSQVIIITHNQVVMDIADVLHGVTMEEKGISKIVAVDLVKIIPNNLNKNLSAQKNARH